MPLNSSSIPGSWIALISLRNSFLRLLKIQRGQCCKAFEGLLRFWRRRVRGHCCILLGTWLICKRFWYRFCNFRWWWKELRLRLYESLRGIGDLEELWEHDMHMKLYRTYRLPYLIFLSLFRVLICVEKIPFIAKLSAGVTCILHLLPLKKVPSHVAPKKKKKKTILY